MALLFLLWPAGLAAQRPAPGDTVRPHALDTLTVTVERTRTPLVNSTAAVGVVRGATLRRLPLPILASSLHLVPGVAVLDFDGAGFAPALTIRGFYGGGEAEYVGVLLDGRPVNSLENGLLNWDLLPAAAVERVEVIRGGAGSLYGDAAIGGVINIITRGSAANPFRWTLSGGQPGHAEAFAGLDRRVSDRPLSLHAAGRRVDGFREHAGRWSGSVGGSIWLRGDPAERGSGISLTTLHHWRAMEDPGPVPSPLLEESRRASAAIYRFDRAEERLHRVALDARQPWARARISSYLVGERRGSSGLRTIPLAPEFADTKERVLTADRLAGSAQLELDHRMGAWPATTLLGVEASVGRLDSEYLAVLSGDPAAYRESDGLAREPDVSGRASRGAAAGFARLELRPASRLRVHLGGRFDALGDRFRRADGGGDAEERSARHAVFSPRVGVNVRYMERARQRGHLYAAAGRSFKAPTLDQLFDQRTVPVPFPPHALSFSNDLLEPQLGTSLEAGIYHRVNAVPERLRVEVELSVYQLRMEQEIDFDLETFRYVNIGRSRHRGLEAGVRLGGPEPFEAFLNYTLQSVTARAGPHSGNQLKAIPRHFLSAGLIATLPAGWSSGLVATAADGIVLDDANTLELPGFWRLDLRLARSVLGMMLYAEVFNVLDREYSVTGFPDPAGSDLVHYYPAAGRLLRLGLASSRRARRAHPDPEEP